MSGILNEEKINILQHVFTIKNRLTLEGVRKGEDEYITKALEIIHQEGERELELLFIRHGESEADLLGVHEGRADFPLTAHGEGQAGKLAEYVAAHYPPDIILASPLNRAKRTAQILQAKVSCEVVEIPDLMEFNNGVLAGLSREEAAARYPLPAGGRPLHIPIQDGESELEFRFRAERVFHQIVYDYREYDRVAIVSHGGLISHFIKVFLHLPVTNETVFPTGDTGIHLLQLKENRRLVRFLNNQEHLR